MEKFAFKTPEKRPLRYFNKFLQSTLLWFSVLWAKIEQKFSESKSVEDLAWEVEG